MNFLSHFYFDRNSDNCYHTVGTVLPDLLKNADKSIILHPGKLIHADENVNKIIKGWNRHLEVDRYFHSSGFFISRSHTLKIVLATAIKGSVVKPFFLGHIGLELLLDNLLITTRKISIDHFYTHLQGCEDEIIEEFLSFVRLKDSKVFFNFYENFKKSRYLHSYREIAGITYALKRICMRVWNDPFTPAQEAALGDLLLIQREGLLNDFMIIFNQIEQQLLA
jgi:hypothetical protein